MTPQPSHQEITKAIEVVRLLVSNASLLRYFYGYETSYLAAGRNMQPMLYISHSQPAAASLIAVFFSDHLGVLERSAIIEEPEEQRYGIEIPLETIQNNRAALQAIATQVDAYVQLLRMLRECPGVVRVQLVHNRLHIHCRPHAASALASLEGIAMLPQSMTQDVPTMFAILAIAPQSLMEQLPELYHRMADLAVESPAILRRAGTPDLAGV